MADYSAETLASVTAALTPGQPASLHDTGLVFSGARTALDEAAERVREAADAVTGGAHPAWAGPAARAFTDVVGRLTGFIEGVAPLLDPYGPALRDAGTALSTAQSQLAQLAATAPTPPDQACDERARDILIELAGRYQDVLGRLGPVATSPQGLREVREAAGDEPEAEGPAPTVLAFHSGGPASGPVPTSVPTFTQGHNPAYPSTFTQSLGSSPVSIPGLGPGPVPGGGVPVIPASAHGIGAPGAGLGGNPSTRLSTVNRVAGIGAGPGLARGGQAPLSPAALTSSLGRSPGAPGARGERTEDGEEQARTQLIGDEDWTDQVGVTGAIGRPAPPAAGER